MNKLKEILFNDALYYWREYRRLAAIYGEFDAVVMTVKAHYNALDDVITESGLTEEYKSFTAEQERRTA